MLVSFVALLLPRNLTSNFRHSMLHQTSVRNFFAIFFLIALTSCAIVHNNPIVTCHHSDGLQSLRLNGYRDNKTHSLIMFAVRPSVAAQTEFIVPGLFGSIPGSSVKWSTYPEARLSGSITITEKTATVDLYLQPNPNSSIPLDWNGFYELQSCDR